MGGGLYLRVTRFGGKLWRWPFECSSKGKLMTFGRCPDVTLALARERHAEARKLLATGIDPMAQRKRDKNVLIASSASSFQSISSLSMEHWRDGKTLVAWITFNGE